MLKKIFFIAVFLVFFAGLGQSASAGLSDQMGNQTGKFLETSGFATFATIGGITSVIIQTVLGLMGIIFIVLLVFAGYQWMTANGNEEKVTKAKDTIFRAIIGLIIVIAAYSITYFVFNALNGSAGSGGVNRPG